MPTKPISEPAGQTPRLESRAAPIIERAPLPIVEVQGKNHLVSHVNSAFCVLIGKSRAELNGKPFPGIVPGGEKCLPILDQVYQTGEAATLAHAQDSEPEPACWLYAMWPALDANEKPVGVIIQLTSSAHFRQNVTAINEALLVAGLRQHELKDHAENLNLHLEVEVAERRKTEETLRLAQAQLSNQALHLEQLVQTRTAELLAANKQLETFVYSIAHDLRAPLRAMQGFSALLIDEAELGLSEEGHGYAHRISNAAQFMDALLVDLLAFSRISQQNLELEPLDLESIVLSGLSGLEKELREKDARVEVIGPWPKVLAHAPSLGQVFTNLLSNALKFVPPGSQPALRLRSEEFSTASDTPPAGAASGLEGPGGHWVRVWVEDNGIGIEPHYHEQIFRLFTRLHGETYVGTGIGLSIVKIGIERMGGRVGLESVAGQGARFWFELRRA